MSVSPPWSPWQTLTSANHGCPLFKGQSVIPVATSLLLVYSTLMEGCIWPVLGGRKTSYEQTVSSCTRSERRGLRSRTCQLLFQRDSSEFIYYYLSSDRVFSLVSKYRGILIMAREGLGRLNLLCVLSWLQLKLLVWKFFRVPADWHC